MNSGIIPWLWSFVMPAVVVQWALLEVMVRAKPGWRGRPWFMASAVVALAIVCCPTGDRPLARQLAGFSIQLSIPLLAVLSGRSVERCFGLAWWRRDERQAIWGFGLAAGLLLYPFALGWTALDSYHAGWPGNSLFWLMAVVSSLALARRNRFGLILLASIGAWHLSLLESRNYWDYLVDPVFFIVALGAVTKHQIARVCSAASLSRNHADGARPHCH